MKNSIVSIPCITKPIRPSPGFRKKLLADDKLDLCGLCGFGCRYCSSNHGNYLRIFRKKFAALTEAQLGRRLLPADEPNLMFIWPDILERLETQLRTQRDTGAGRTLVVSMLTDPFSPVLVANGTTERALAMVLERTSYRLRILTKSSVVGQDHWLRFFSDHPGRFVVGLSVGSSNDDWARRVELGTPPPSARLRALQHLQAAGVPTFGMLCPLFPDVLTEDHLERIVDDIRPGVVEYVWAEPYNDRLNWRAVRDVYDKGAPGHAWLTHAFERRDRAPWSRYATDLYCRLRVKAEAEGWLGKLRFLLYEAGITPADHHRYLDLDGLLLQSAPDAQGLSQNSHFRALQQRVADDHP